MKFSPTLIAVLLCVTGCSPDAATTAATVGKLQAQQVEEANKQQEEFKQKLGAALKAEDAAASAAGNQ